MGPTTALLARRPRANCQPSRMLISPDPTIQLNRPSPTIHFQTFPAAYSSVSTQGRCPCLYYTYSIEHMNRSFCQLAGRKGSTFIHGATSTPDAIVASVPSGTHEVGNINIAFSYIPYS